MCQCLSPSTPHSSCPFLSFLSLPSPSSIPPLSPPLFHPSPLPLSPIPPPPYRPTRLTLKGAKKHYFLLKGTSPLTPLTCALLEATVFGDTTFVGTILTCYKDEAAYSEDQFLEKFNLTGAEVSPDVDVSKNRFIINIAIAAAPKEENVRLVLEDVSGGRRRGTTDAVCVHLAAGLCSSCNTTGSLL